MSGCTVDVATFYDWEDKEAIAILRTCRAAMSDGSKLILIERILPEQIDPDDALTRAKFGCKKVRVRGHVPSLPCRRQIEQ